MWGWVEAYYDEIGRRVIFGRTHHCGNSPVCLAFHDLFEIARDKDVSEGRVWDPIGASGSLEYSVFEILQRLGDGFSGGSFFFYIEICGLA